MQESQALGWRAARAAANHLHHLPPDDYRIGHLPRQLDLSSKRVYPLSVPQLRESKVPPL